MAKKPPYTSSQDIEELFARIGSLAEPAPPKQVDANWVKAYGFETAHPGAIPSLLKWLGVLDENGVSTGVWNDLRVESRRAAVLPALIRDAYGPVFAEVDLATATDSDLRGAFISAYSVGDARRHITCFRTLCRIAGVEIAGGQSQAEPSTHAPKAPKKKAPSVKKTVAHAPVQGSSAPAVSLLVEIPASWSEEEIEQRIRAVSRATKSINRSADD